MKQTGTYNADFGPDRFGFQGLTAVHWNHQAPLLYGAAVQRFEAKIASGGALVADTISHAGLSPKDKFIVRDSQTETTVWWENNNAISSAQFDTLRGDFIAYAKGRELFAQDLYAAADPSVRVKARVFTELAWHSLFIRNMLIRPDIGELAHFVPDLTIVNLPSFRADPKRHGCRGETIVACDFSRRVLLIGGADYAGEMKKSVFSYLNYTLPELGVMPMHCSANSGGSNEVAVFFGRSGAGKTTLSIDPTRILIGDDEHGWSRHGVFNFEGGCYAKAFRLSREAEPEIYATTERFGTVMENVALDPVTHAPDFDDGAKTENGRIAYPLDFIANASSTGRDGRPKNIVMLTCDAFGVLPPIAKLDPSQAMYHFLSGYTAKIAGAENGAGEPQATFSTCFGARSMPRHPSVYANLLRELIEKHHVDCWLVNTGWTGGKYGAGRRMPIRVTRRLIAAALDGSLNRVNFRSDPYFGLAAPVSVPGVEPHILEPVKTWASKADFAETAKRLVAMFRDNFARFEKHVDEEVRQAAPAPRISAA
jgi:phosphoenolpyruvate carboxykinase (ATP)